MTTQLPTSALAQHLGIFGTTGSGKSYHARGRVEQVMYASAAMPRMCIIDPKGDWYGLRLAANGKGAGLPFTIVGGPHADVGLRIDPKNPEPVAAPLASMIARSDVRCIIDLSDLDAGKMRRFVATLLGTLYHENRQQLYLVVDEADEFAPMSSKGGGEVLLSLGAMERIAKRGRGRGFVLWTISQRPASVHTDIRGMCQALVVMKLTLPHDRKAIQDWFMGQVPGDQADAKAALQQVIDSLPKLETGEGWLWWPQGGVLARQRSAKIATFDSMRAPGADDAAHLKALPAIDTTAVTSALEAATKEAIENDPRTLRKRIADLERELKAKPAPAAAVDSQAIERAVTAAVLERDRHWSAEVERLRKCASVLRPVHERLQVVMDAVDGVRISLDAKPAEPPTLSTRTVDRPAVSTKPVIPARSVNRPAAAVAAGDVTRSELACLSAFKWYALLGIDEPTSDQLCYKLGYSPNSSTMSVLLSKLRKGGYLDGSRLTDAGAALVPEIRLGTIQEFHDSIRAFLDGSARKLFDLLLANHPSELSAEQICEGVSPPWSTTSSTLSVAASALRRAGLMTKRGYQLTEAVFPKV